MKSKTQSSPETLTCLKCPRGLCNPTSSRITKSPQTFATNPRGNSVLYFSFYVFFMKQRNKEKLNTKIHLFVFTDISASQKTIHLF